MINRIRLGMAIACLFSFPVTAAGWNWADDPSLTTQHLDFEGSQAICRLLRDLQPPPSDYPDPAEAALRKDCRSGALYYGIGMTADPVGARQCALLELEQEDGNTGYPAFAGTSMLMTIYANGIGAQRDLDLATALACRIKGAPMEVDGRVHHLQNLKAENWTGQDFSFCDDITSGMAGGICASFEADISDARRSESLKRLVTSWEVSERGAFERLWAAQRHYAEESGLNEVDRSGTARVAFMVEQQQRLHDAFATLLGRLEAGRLPTGTRAHFQATDDQLNVVYRHLMSLETNPVQHGVNADTLPLTTVTKAGIRTTQRAWLVYRDAWLAFASSRYPALSRDSLGAWLTRERADELASHMPEATNIEQIPTTSTAPTLPSFEVLSPQAWKALNDATGVVTGGERDAGASIQVIIDVNCSYCRSLYHQLLETHLKTSIRWVPVAFVKPDSETIAAAILAAEDPQAALHQFFNGTDSSDPGAVRHSRDGHEPGTLPKAQVALEEDMMDWGGFVPMTIVRTSDGQILMQGGSASELELILSLAAESP